MLNNKVGRLIAPGRFATTPSVAGMELERVLFAGDGPQDDLLRYCERDAFGLVKVLSRLRELVRGGLSLKVDSTVSIELDNAAEGAHGRCDVGSCSSL